MPAPPHERVVFIVRPRQEDTPVGKLIAGGPIVQGKGGVAGFGVVRHHDGGPLVGAVAIDRRPPETSFAHARRHGEA